jgi:hypothetical protein
MPRLLARRLLTKSYRDIALSGHPVQPELTESMSHASAHMFKSAGSFH